MLQKQNLQSTKINQGNLFENYSTSKDISEEIISKLEELNRRLDSLLWRKS